MQTQTRLLLEEQSNQGLHCLLFHLHHFETFLCCKDNLFEFQGYYSNTLGVLEFKTFTVFLFGFRAWQDLTGLRQSIGSVEMGKP